MKAPRHRSHRGTTANSAYDSLSPVLSGTFLPMLLTPNEDVFDYHTDTKVLAST